MLKTVRKNSAFNLILVGSLLFVGSSVWAQDPAGPPLASGIPIGTTFVFKHTVAETFDKDVWVGNPETGVYPVGFGTKRVSMPSGCLIHQDALGRVPGITAGTETVLVQNGVVTHSFYNDKTRWPGELSELALQLPDDSTINVTCYSVEQKQEAVLIAYSYSYFRYIVPAQATVALVRKSFDLKAQ